MQAQLSSEFLHSAHPPSLRLGELLGAKLRGLAGQAALPAASLWLRGAGTLDVDATVEKAGAPAPRKHKH